MDNVNLNNAVVSNSRLLGANLEKATLVRADMRECDMMIVNLSGANAKFANLSSANLSHAKLRDCDLRYANLEGADLSFADLRGVNLKGANLRDANLDHVIIDEHTLKGVKINAMLFTALCYSIPQKAEGLVEDMERTQLMFASVDTCTSSIRTGKRYYRIEYQLINGKIIYDSYDDSVVIERNRFRIMINSLASDLYKSVKSQNSMNSMKTIDSACPICLVDFEDDDIVSQLDCKHVYHKNCIRVWIKSKHLSCPNCRAGITVDTIQPSVRITDI